MLLRQNVTYKQNWTGQIVTIRQNVARQNLAEAKDKSANFVKRENVADN